MMKSVQLLTVPVVPAENIHDGLKYSFNLWGGCKRKVYVKVALGGKTGSGGQNCRPRLRGRPVRPAALLERHGLIHPVVVFQDLFSVEPSQALSAGLGDFDETVGADLTPAIAQAGGVADEQVIIGAANLRRGRFTLPACRAVVLGAARGCRAVEAAKWRPKGRRRSGRAGGFDPYRGMPSA
jgi:hypothetical protein